MDSTGDLSSKGGSMHCLESEGESELILCCSLQLWGVRDWTSVMVCSAN